MSNPLEVIDLKNPNEDELVLQMLNAAKNQGFLFIDGHNFTQDEISFLLNLSKEFFKLSNEEKNNYLIDETNKGYSCLLSEKLDLDKETKRGDPKEAFNFGDINFTSGKPNQELPSLFLEKENFELICKINKKLYELILKILYYLSIGLKIEDKNWFYNKNKPDKPNGSILRFLKYPSLSDIESNNLIRAGAHTDYGTVTALFQFKNQEGLELNINKEWLKVPFIESKYDKSCPPLIINFGDQLNYWTNGFLKSTIHRVKFKENSVNDRYSIVFFSHPADDTLLEPIPSELIGVKKGDGKVITSREYLNKKLDATYFR